MARNPDGIRVERSSPEGADAEDADREAADILFPKVAETSAADGVAGLDRLFE